MLAICMGSLCVHCCTFVHILQVRKKNITGPSIIKAAKRKHVSCGLWGVIVGNQRPGVFVPVCVCVCGWALCVRTKQRRCHSTCAFVFLPLSLSCLHLHTHSRLFRAIGLTDADGSHDAAVKCFCLLYPILVRGGCDYKKTHTRARVSVK